LSFENVAPSSSFVGIDWVEEENELHWQRDSECAFYAEANLNGESARSNERVSSILDAFSLIN
jgi:hypothetical protein